MLPFSPTLTLPRGFFFLCCCFSQDERKKSSSNSQIVILRTSYHSSSGNIDRASQLTMESSSSSSKKILLFKLPAELLIPLLSEWLSIEDVAKLDTAMANRSHRGAFLQLLENVRTEIHCDLDASPRLHWLSLRRIHVESMELTLKNNYLKKNCKRLKSYNIELLERIPLSKLRKLVLYSRKFRLLPDVVMSHIGSVCSVLEHLQLNVESEFNAVGFLSILRRCQMLKSIDLGECILKRFTATDIEGMHQYGHLFTTFNITSITPQFLDLIVRCPNLKKVTFAIQRLDLVRLPEIGFSFQDRGCPNAGLLLLQQHCKQLLTIRFLNCGCLTDASLAHISQIQSLQNLDLSNCKTVTDVGLHALFRGCPNLQSFSLTKNYGVSISDQGFWGLRNALCSQSLVNIELRFCDRPVPFSPAFEVVLGESLACCHNLATVLIRGGDFGDTGMALMCGGCLNLKSLALTQSESLTIDGLLLAASTCPLLREMEVKGVSTVVIRKFNERFPAVMLSDS